MRMDAETCADIRSQLHRSPGADITIDLPAQLFTLPGGRTLPFEIDPFRRQCLVRGIDDIDYTFDYVERIAAWEAKRNATTPWTGPVTDASLSSGPLPEEASA
jgi:3-isopropylmalate/(R)-2-methylmalate dehydratase small subunit